MNDQTSPKHYQTKIQAIDFIQANNLNFCEGNVIKYIARYREKGGIDDLLKAKQYIEYLIKDYKEKKFGLIHQAPIKFLSVVAQHMKRKKINIFF